MYIIISALACHNVLQMALDKPVRINHIFILCDYNLRFICISLHANNELNSKFNIINYNIIVHV